VAAAAAAPPMVRCRTERFIVMLPLPLVDAAPRGDASRRPVGRRLSGGPTTGRALAFTDLGKKFRVVLRSCGASLRRCGAADRTRSR
jgi:hypothetical protein